MKSVKNCVLLTTIIIIFSIAFCYLYVYNEDNVYVYDYVGYQLRYNSISELVKTDVQAAIKEIILSIRNLDYNLFPVIFLIPFYLIIGESRIVYECSMVLLYVVPAIILTIYYLYNCVYKKSTIKYFNVIVFLMIVFLTFTYTRWWSPTLRGLPDIIGIIPLIILLYIFGKTSFLKKIRLYKLIIIGTLVYIPFLCRRWYAYNIVAYYLTIFIISVIQFILSKKDKKRLFINAVVNFMVSGCTTVALACLCQLPLIKVILAENYSTSYSAFQVPLIQHFINFYDEFGIIIIIFSIISILISFIKKKNRKLILYCVLNILIFSILFSNTQAMGVHHFLGITIYIFVLFILGIFYIIDYIKCYKLKILFIVIIVLLSLINFYSTFISDKIDINFVTQNNKYYKLQYENYDNLLKLKNDLSKLLVNNDKFVVMGSTGNISDSLIDVIGDNSIKNNIIYNSVVDLRDGIKIDALLAKYVIVTDPEQYSMNKEGQQVMLYPNYLILNNKGIGKAYKKISDEYLLANGCKVYIYEKQRNFTKEEIEEYLSYFYNKYPQWETEYGIIVKMLLSSEYELGKNIGAINIIDNDTIYMHPGYSPTKFTINSIFSESIKLKFYIQGEIPENSDTAGIVNITLYGDSQKIYSSEITKENSKVVELKLSDYDKLILEVDSGEKLDCDWLYVDIILN